jgi:sarcosine oxidase subunit alpha
MDALRIEKGHVGRPEIDGRTTLDDLGLGGMASKKKGFVGEVLRRRPGLIDPGRRRLVGLESLEPGQRLRCGAILFAGGEKLSGHGRGHVTSVTYSPTLDRYIALALYEGGLARAGEEVVAAHPVKGETVRARITSPVFLDPQGERLRG